MALRRMLNKSISLSAQVNQLSDAAEILFTWAIPHFDDEGRMRGEPNFVKAAVVPLKKWTERKIIRLIDEIITARLWDVYKSDGVTIIQGVKWYRHQRIQPSKFRPSDLPKKDITS